jgi:serine/threonine-protein kinase RsbW
MGKPISLKVSADMTLEPLVIRWAEAVARQYGLAEHRINDLKTAVGEAFTNAVEHGGRTIFSSGVTLRAGCVGSDLTIEIADCGSGFDPRRIPEPDLAEKMNQEKPGRGWGLYLIKRLVDRVEVQNRFPVGTRLELIMDLERKPDSTPVEK